VISSADQSNMTSVAKAAGDASSLLPYGFENMRIRLNEALELYDTMFKESGDKIRVLVGTTTTTVATTAATITTTTSTTTTTTTFIYLFIIIINNNY
jgi:hypothetical protein